MCVNVITLAHIHSLVYDQIYVETSLYFTCLNTFGSGSFLDSFFFFFLCQTLSIGYVVIISSTWAVDDECPVQTCWPVEGGGWEITCNRTGTAFVLWMKSWQLWLNHAATIQCWHKTPVVCEKAPPLMHFKLKFLSCELQQVVFFKACRLGHTFIIYLVS